MLACPGRVVVALSLTLSAAGFAQSGGFEYAPSTGQYRLSSVTKGAQEAMGQKQEFETSNKEVVTVTVARSAKDTLTMTIIIDSIAVVGPMGAVPPGIEKLRGARIVAKLAPFGRPYSVVGPTDDSIPQGSQITDELSRFLPRIKTKLAPGATWADTTTGKIKQAGIEVDRRVVANYSVAGDTTVGGEKSWKIARQSVTTSTGSGTSQGQVMTMEGTANGKATIVVSQKGEFLGSQGSDETNIKILVAASGLEVAVTTSGNTNVEKIR